MLKFISDRSLSIRLRLPISKHLMLKFIKHGLTNMMYLKNFKTSHVKVYLFKEDWLAVFIDDFKTSHVKVYLRQLPGKIWQVYHFKTSHVKVYRRGGEYIQKDYKISKHLMLKFIQRISRIPYNTRYQISQYLSRFLKFLPATAPFAKKIYKITAMPLFLRIHAILH